MSLKPYTITSPISGGLQISGSGIHATKHLLIVGTNPSPGTENFLNIIDTDTTAGDIKFGNRPLYQPGQIQIFKNISGSNGVVLDGGLGDLASGTINEYESYIVMGDLDAPPKLYFTLSSYKQP
jgi:hypothetical protein